MTDPADPATAVAQAQRGDEQAFALLYQQRVAAVYRYAYGILRHKETAEDVTAQTFLQAWRHLPRLRDPARFDGWLFRIAHNQAINATRGAPAADLAQVAEPADTRPDADPAGHAERAADAARVRGALLRLPEHLREVLVLRFYAGLSHAEVAAQVGKSEANARVMQYRALQQLRQHLDSAPDAG